VAIDLSGINVKFYNDAPLPKNEAVRPVPLIQPFLPNDYQPPPAIYLPLGSYINQKPAVIASNSIVSFSAWVSVSMSDWSASDAPSSGEYDLFTFGTKYAAEFSAGAGTGSTNYEYPPNVPILDPPSRIYLKGNVSTELVLTADFYDIYGDLVPPGNFETLPIPAFDLSPTPFTLWNWIRFSIASPDKPVDLGASAPSNVNDEIGLPVRAERAPFAGGVAYSVVTLMTGTSINFHDAGQVGFFIVLDPFGNVVLDAQGGVIAQEATGGHSTFIYPRVYNKFPWQIFFNGGIAGNLFWTNQGGGGAFIEHGPAQLVPGPGFTQPA
jgi:hypothetical protein